MTTALACIATLSTVAVGERQVIARLGGRRRALWICGVALVSLLVLEMTAGCGHRKMPSPPEQDLAQGQSPPIPAYRDMTPRTLLRAPCPAGEVERLAWHAAGPDGQPLEEYAISTWRWRQQDVMIAEYPPPDSDAATRLWIDWDGDGRAEEVYDSVDAMGKQYPHSCLIFEKARRLAGGG